MSIFHFLISFLYIACLVQSETNLKQNSTTHRSSSACLTLFDSNRAHFDPCRTRVCFLFRGQAPVSDSFLYFPIIIFR